MTGASDARGKERYQVFHRSLIPVPRSLFSQKRQRLK